MPTPPVIWRPRGKPKILIEISSDEDDGGDAEGDGAVIASGGEGPKRIKQEPVDDVGINVEIRGGRGRALAVNPLRSENPVSPPPRATGRPSGRPQPEVIDISSSDDDGKEEFPRFRAESPPRQVFQINGSGHGERRVKEEPFDCSDSRAPSSAAGACAMVGDSAPRSSAKRKRKRESPGRARRGARGDHGAKIPGPSGIGRRETEMGDEARSSRERNNGNNKGGHGERRVEKDPLDGSDSQARSSAAGGCAMVGDSSPRSSAKRKRKRKRESTGRARRGARGDHGAKSSIPGASGIGRRETEMGDEARSSTERNNGKNKGGHGERRVKEEPFDGSDSLARSSAEGARAMEGDSAPRSSAKMKRKRESTGRARRGARGDHGAKSLTPGASGIGRRETEMGDEARSSRERNNGKNKGAIRKSKVNRSRLAKEALVSSDESWHAPGKVRRGRSMTSGERRSSSPPVNSASTTVGSRIRSRVRQGRMQQASHSSLGVSDGEEDEDQQGRVHSASRSARQVSDDTDDNGEGEEEDEQRPVQRASHSARVMPDDIDEDGDEQENQEVRVQHASQHTAPVVPYSNGDGKAEEEQQEREERREDMAMEVDGEGSEGGNGVSHEREHGEYVVGENRENDNGEEDQAAAAAADDDYDDGGEQQEREENNEVEEEERSSEEDSIYEGDEEDGEEEAEEEEEEFDGAEVAPSHTPSNAVAAGSTRSGGEDTGTFRKIIFDGLCLPEKPDKTVGEGIGRRTRSNRKCSDRKLLTRGFFSKPVKIDIDSTSESEEEIPPPAPMWQGLLSSSEDDSNEGPRKGIRRRKDSGPEKKASTSSDEYVLQVYTRRKKGGPSNGHSKEKGGPSNGHSKEKGGPSNGQAGREGDKTYAGSNPNRPMHGGSNRERAMNNAQDDLSFKQRANLATMKKQQSSRAKAAYDELFNAMFAEWENYTKPPAPADAQNDNALPLTFSFGDEDEGTKSDTDKFEEELWREFDAALEFINAGSHGCEEDNTCNAHKVPPEVSCENGRHEYIIDEQIGVRCMHCNVMDLEIRYVLPSMGRFATGRDSTTNPELNPFKEMLTLFEKNDLLVSNGNEGTSRIGAGKAGSVWDLIPGVKEDMFLHQQDAFEFVWRKLAGGTKIEEIEELRRTGNTDTGGGCVISHAPGTGKTRLAITFVQSYLEVFPRSCPVIIAPRAMLATWEQEFKKWKVKLPFHVLNSTEINYSDDKTIQAQIEKDGSFARRLWANKLDQNYRRLLKLTSWVNGTSVIGASYSLFRKLANDDGMDGDNVRKLLLERPDLLVLDEGHTPRNKKSLIWKVLSKVRTEKRIILSGTLFQNNFEELYNTLYLVRPKDAMLLEKDEGKDWNSLRLSNITEENIDKVRAKLEPVVHYHKGNFLEKSLPGLKETVVILNPLPRQKDIIASLAKTAAMGTLDAEYKTSLVLVHPSLITSAKLSEKEARLVDHTLLESLRLDPCEGVKTRFVMEVVQQCQALNERVLVFSQYLEPLSLIMDQLKRRFNWTEDKEILQMSGNVRLKQREATMAAFNNMKSEARVMLASTKACCEGITLVGASRVVLLDVVWNPSVGRQAIGRAYRFGQKKIVYTYNLIADGTKEMEKYSRQAKKEDMSKKLFSNEKQPEGGNISPESTFDDRVLEAMTSCEELKDLFVQIRIENQTDQGGAGNGAGKCKSNNLEGA